MLICVSVVNRRGENSTVYGEKKKKKVSFWDQHIVAAGPPSAHYE